MFHWICPECGREIAPSVKECPACDPAAAHADPELVGVTASVPQQAGLAALTPEVVFAPRVERSRPVREEAPVLTIDAQPVIDVEPGFPELAIVAEPPPEPAAPAEPASRAEPLTDAELPLDAEPVEALATAAAVPVIDIEPVIDPIIDAIIEPVSEPAVPEPPDPAVAPPSALPQAAAIAPPAPRLRPEDPLLPEDNEPVLTTAPIAEPVERTLSVAPDQRADHRDFLPLQPMPVATEPAPPEPSEPPATVRPHLASPGPQPPVGDLRIDTDAAMARVRPAHLEGRPSGGTNEHISIPGPALPIELTSLEGAGISKVLKPRAAKAAAKPTMSGWLLSGLVAATVVATCISAALYLIPAGAAPVPAPKAAVKTPAKPVSPLTKFVEVTGFRHVTMSDKSEIRYLVVNHSAALLSDVTVFVTLRAPEAEPGSAPVSNFSFKMPKLGPWESKEMVSPVEKVTRPGAMPEWRELTAEVEIGQ